MKTATFVMQVSETKNLYRMHPPLGGFDLVVASTAFAMGPETYLFGANEDGSIVEFDALDGSFRGEGGDERAMREAGYVIAEPVQ